ncbi:c-type cytochrome [Thalassotalea sp. Y01]|uniref:c-type cytochrome n=1 Tax=Thalassotalea sp. Y01 TaxID=2729613 RepID=UPI00145EA3F6|nr:c-type cytochrome [Thalassotalea sp. Y01]NMP16971.1 c-type cytochrome [Thalassotalea sp. Y01]
MVNNKRIFSLCALLWLTGQSQASQLSMDVIEQSVVDKRLEQGLAFAEQELKAERLAQQKLKQNVAYCTPCHGGNGKGALAIYPDLAGHNQDYLFEQMQNYKYRRLKNDIKQTMMVRFNDEDMLALAEYFAGFALEQE